MSALAISSVGVIGIGTMGNGIAQVCAQQGLATTILDVDDGALERGMGAIRKSLDRLVASYEKSGGEKGLSADMRSEAEGRLKTTLVYSDLLGCDIVIEAATERLEIKQQIFGRLKELGYGGIVATNTSSISITKLAASAPDPARFMGMHFMNPVPLQQGVEIIRGLLTSDATAEAVVGLTRALGKTEIPAEDKAGFGINRMWVPFVNEACRVVDEGVMAPDEADKCTLCLGHRMGPLATADYVGLDVIKFICDVLEEEFGSAYKASPLLRRLVEAGQLGVKTGAGFYLYADRAATGVNPAVTRKRAK
jgi:3-hydroxybutyryl-CoA dehydrogenase